MSAPMQGHDRPEPALLYAPRWARAARPSRPQGTRDNRDVAELTGAPPMAPDAAGPTNSPPMAPGLGGFNIEAPPARPFEGDVAIKELRRQLSLDPNLVPAPPLRLRRRQPPWLAALSLVMLAAIGAVGIALLIMPAADVTGAARTGDRSIAVVAAPPLDPLSGPSAPLPRLVVEGQRAFANDPMPLGIALTGAAGGETLNLIGLAAGTRLSGGTPRGQTGWQVSARELGRTFAYAPKDFVGVMEAAIDLRSANDRLMDSQVVRLEWIWRKADTAAAPALRRDPVAPPVSAASLDSDELATLIERGHDFLKAGDIPSARLVLRRAANAGNAQAALALGGTYDAVLLSELGVVGFLSDAAQARIWYQRALELGSSEAPSRLDRMTSVER
jgi:hypothetical protein